MNQYEAMIEDAMKEIRSGSADFYTAQTVRALVLVLVELRCLREEIRGGVATYEARY